jgi:hypothetical protein
VIWSVAANIEACGRAFNLEIEAPPNPAKASKVKKSPTVCAFPELAILHVKRMKTPPSVISIPLDAV